VTPSIGDDGVPPEQGTTVPRDAMSLQTAWLRSFLAVADRGGFGTATHTLHLSQSRVSAHIAALEHALGVTLFDRKARPICTTRAGELFYGHARAALQELQRGVDAARSTQDQLIAHLTVASYPSVSSTYLPALLQFLKSEYPGLTVDLWEGTAATLEEAVATGVVDIAFRPTLPKVREPTLCHRTIWQEDIVAVMRDSDPLAKQTTINIADILARPLIGNPAGSEEDGGGFDLRHMLGEYESKADIAYLTDHPATLIALVRSAFGIGIINQLALETTTTDGLTVRRIESPTAHRDVALFWTRRRSSNAAVCAFLLAQARTPLPPRVRPLQPAG
jgi:LysR family carnitine catabolism transcriptional activator